MVVGHVRKAAPSESVLPGRLADDNRANPFSLGCIGHLAGHKGTANIVPQMGYANNSLFQVFPSHFYEIHGCLHIF